jgi:hypothetical protein
MDYDTRLDQLSPFVRSYIETALWSSTDDTGTPLDSAEHSGTELAESTIQRFIADCEKFETESDPIINSVTEYHAASLLSRQPIAHDFWLTRNRHGAGFWDGDYPEPIATQLTDLAHSFGECDLYIGDDGKIYC